METAQIEKLVPGGQGIATLASGKKAFIWNALPGETVDFTITKQKTSYCEGLATRIIHASSARISPRDDCYLATSPWQIIDYAEELRQKQQLVSACFEQHQLQLEVLPTITDGQDFFYRNKMEYSLYWNNDDSKIYPAFHQRGTHRKIPITQSSIERPDVFAAVSQLIAELNARHAAARDYQSILVRCDQHGNTSTALFENHKAHPVMQKLHDQLLGHQYSYSPNGFFQINLPVYELALQAIAERLTGQAVIDLYAGVGSIGLSVARDKRLTMVEVNAAAFTEMQANAAGSQAECILAKSEDVTAHISANHSVILDPPRAGCDNKLIDALNQIQPAQIIYLSCNPITQARDLSLLREHYHISALQPFNFFPRTPHIENLAILERR